MIGYLCHAHCHAHGIALIAGCVSIAAAGLLVLLMIWRLEPVSLLCLLGFHRWRERELGPIPLGLRAEECGRCGRRRVRR